MLYDCRSTATRDQGIEAAVSAVQRGDLVVLPTDTRYGVAADAFKTWAVNALLSAKGNRIPPPVLVGTRNTLDGLVFGLSQVARDLVEAFWPGPLTVIVEHAPSLQWDLGDDMGGIVAVRMPLHPVALEVLRQTGPVALTGANKTGQPPASTAEEARDQFGYSVAVYLEAGPSPDTPPSTVLDLTGDVPRIVRAGALSLEKLREVAPNIVGLEEPTEPEESAESEESAEVEDPQAREESAEPGEREEPEE
jgi:L-threonylcarbamoyladenylate synthase